MKVVLLSSLLLGVALALAEARVDAFSKRLPAAQLLPLIGERLRSLNLTKLSPADHILVSDNPLWKDCSSGDDKSRLTINSVEVSPNPPKKGADVVITANFTLRNSVVVSTNSLPFLVKHVEQVTSGTVKVTLSYGSVPLVDETLDLCDLVTQIHKQCPLQTGPFTLQLKENIPDYVPSGAYEGKATLSDQNGKEMACLDINLQL